MNGIKEMNCLINLIKRRLALLVSLATPSGTPKGNRKWMESNNELPNKYNLASPGSAGVAGHTFGDPKGKPGMNGIRNELPKEFK